MTKTRSPIISVLGHVDHGKSSILDKIRGGTIVNKEAGGITQAIGASIVPLDTIKKICGPLINPNLNFTIPGLLFIDTPGHAAFTSLRKRGGNLADIAIVVIDVNEGFKPQTIETIEILKSYKTPFIVAANKIDLCANWNNKDTNISKKLKDYGRDIQILDEKIYNLVAQFAEHCFNAERFDRVDNYTEQIAIVPICAKTGEGLPELLMVLIGLAQKFLEQNLQTAEGPGKGTILEVKEEVGLGTTIDVILYDGTLKQSDTIIIGSMNKPIVTKIRGLFQPDPLAEMRDKKSKFKPVKKVHAAIGIKISAPGLEDVLSGMPIRSADSKNKKEIDKIKEQIREEVEEVLIEIDEEGVVIKADNLGSLEAMIKLLKEKKISIKSASVGLISKKDIANALANYEKNPAESAILAFNTNLNPDAKANLPEKVKIIKSEVIYAIIDEYEKWSKELIENMESKQLDAVIRPCKIQLLKNYVFRQSNPAIIGGEVLAGKIRTGMPLINLDGKEITTVKSIQIEQESKSSLEKGKQAALSLEGVTIGRQITGEDILYSAISEQDFRKLKELKDYLTEDEKETAKEIAQIKRKNDPVWGI